MISGNGTLYLNCINAFKSGTCYVALGKSLSPLSQFILKNIRGKREVGKLIPVLCNNQICSEDEMCESTQNKT